MATLRIVVGLSLSAVLLLLALSHPGFADDEEITADELAYSVVLLKSVYEYEGLALSSLGTAFFEDQQYLITARHHVVGQHRLFVYFNGQEIAVNSLAAENRERDLVRLHVSLPEELQQAVVPIPRYSSEDPLKPGDEVTLMGFASGETEERDPHKIALSLQPSNIVKDHTIEIYNDQDQVEGVVVYQHSIPMQKGLRGSPLLVKQNGTIYYAGVNQYRSDAEDGSYAIASQEVAALVNRDRPAMLAEFLEEWQGSDEMLLVDLSNFYKNSNSNPSSLESYFLLDMLVLEVQLKAYKDGSYPTLDHARYANHFYLFNLELTSNPDYMDWAITALNVAMAMKPQTIKEALSPSFTDELYGATFAMRAQVLINAARRKQGSERSEQLMEARRLFTEEVVPTYESLVETKAHVSDYHLSLCRTLYMLGDDEGLQAAKERFTKNNHQKHLADLDKELAKADQQQGSLFRFREALASVR